MFKPNQPDLKFHWPQTVKKLIPFVLFCIVIGINIYFRLFPAYFPQLKQQAKINVENNDIEAISKKVEDTYPDFNPLIKKKIILKIFEDNKTNKSGFKKEIKDEYNKLKAPYQDEHGQTYILEVDGYQWMRYVENILKNGHPGDRLKDGYPYDDYMFAPLGVRVVPEQLFFYLSAYLYRAATFFFKNIPLVSFLFFLPLFYSFLFLTLLYLIIRNFFSDLAAFFGVLFVGLNAVVLSRTCSGWFDYDGLTLMLPLVIVWLLSLSFSNKYTLKQRFFYVLFSTFMTVVYCVIWTGYWWIFGICIAYYLYTIANTYSLNKKAHKEALTHIFLAAIFFISSLALCSFVLEYSAFKNIFILLGQVLRLGNSQQISIWPYTFYTVGELAKATPQQIITNLGGPVIAAFATIGVLWIYIKEKRTEKKDFVGLMVFWFFAMCFAALKGFRFIFFLTIPVGIFFGAFIEDISKYIRNKLNKKPIMLFISLGIFFIIILCFFGRLYKSGLAGMNSAQPLMNDSWEKALVYLEKNTSQNSVIDTWWDYGNFFKTVSKRKVIFDPQSQYANLSYWMAQVLYAENENRALNILRMINNSSFTLFEEMQKEIKDDFQCVELLTMILDSNEKDAEKILEKKNISSKLKEKIMESVFLKEPAPAYFLVEKSMIYKTPNISFLGNWDFSKLYVIRNKNLSKAQTIENLMKIFYLSKAQAEKTYNEAIIATDEDETSEMLSRRYAFTFVIDKGNEDKGIVYFDVGIVLNLSDFSARILTLEKGYKKYKYVFIYDGSKFSVYENKDTDYKESILFVKNKNNWRAIGLPKELAQSLFVKLYFLNGKELRCFEPFYSDDEAGIFIYKIKWPKENN